MAILKFRVYLEEDESVYRDVVIRHTQSFQDLHEAILKSYEFDNKHKATFFRSNDHWLKGREISLEKYDKEYVAAPLLMSETTIGSEIKNPNQLHQETPVLIKIIEIDKTLVGIFYFRRNRCFIHHQWRCFVFFIIFFQRNFTAPQPMIVTAKESRFMFIVKFIRL